MGQVYRATDTKLKRLVAIKILPPAFAADADRLARFQREAEVLASLNHPNIAAIHGLEEGTGVSALVMELVEGDDLSQRIARGAIPLDEALPIAKQIAEALEAAHEQNIIHRDLKPANIKVRADGTVKVLDFGLAKAFDAHASGASANGMNSLTITSPAMTQAGMILGTAAYMSPEQSRGRAVDRRADIWAFGAVLFEMLTGTRAFAGDNITDTLAAVVSAEPDWRLLPAGLPPAVGSCVRRCLHKDPRQRVQAIGDVRLALEGAFETTTPQAAATVHIAPPAWRRALPLVTLLVGAVASAVVAWSIWPRAQPGAVNRFVHILPDDQATLGAARPVVALSPDGRSIAYDTPLGLYLRTLDALEGRLITAGEGVSNPFFSPDGRSIGYFVGYELKRLSVSGGASIFVSRTTSNPLGATWTIDDTILFGQAEGVFRVPAAGGTPELVIRASEGERVFGPELLPDRDSVLVTVTTGTWDEGRIVVASLSTGERTVLLEGGSDARFVPTGHLIYALGDALFAVAFDPDRRAVSGRSVPVLQGLMRSSAGSLASGTANYDVANNGMLVYMEGRSFTPRTLVWRDRNGAKVSDTNVRGPRLVHPEVSPDGASVAYAAVATGPGDLGVWTQSFASGARTLLGPGYRPVWAPDGSAVAFNSGLNTDVIVRRVDGTGQGERVVATPADENVGDWSSDGKYLFFDRRDAVTGWDLWYLERAEAGGRWASEARVFLKEPAAQFVPKLSPNGRYVAFVSPQSGRNEVYVRPFPDGSRQWTVSNHGGTRHRWSRAGDELFYLEGDTLMAVTVSTDGEFSHGLPQPLFRNKGLAIGLTDMATYDVSRDGQRFLVVEEADAAPGAAQAGRIIIVENWLEELKRLVPVGK